MSRTYEVIRAEWQAARKLANDTQEKSLALFNTTIKNPDKAAFEAAKAEAIEASAKRDALRAEMTAVSQ